MPQARKRQSSSRTTSRQNNSTQEKQDEADRYRRAAEDALQQLDWAIGYLHGIRKTDISKALANNRSYIRKRLMGQAEEPVPTQQTDQT
jgi:Flp pilus assembly protein TadG